MDQRVYAEGEQYHTKRISLSDRALNGEGDGHVSVYLDHRRCIACMRSTKVSLEAVAVQGGEKVLM